MLAAIGLSDEEAHGSIRFGLGRATTEAEIDTTVTELADAVKMAEVIRAVARTAASGAF